MSVARALDLPPEAVLRRAGLLPQLSPAFEEEQEIVTILREQQPGVRRLLLSMLRGLARRPVSAGEDPWWQAIREELEPLTDDQRAYALDAIRQLRRQLAQPAVRIIGEEECEPAASQPNPG